MPDFDFDAFNHDTPYEGDDNGYAPAEAAPIAGTEAFAEIATAAIEKTEPEVEVPKTEDATPIDNGSTEEVDRW